LFLVKVSVLVKKMVNWSRK